LPSYDQPTLAPLDIQKAYRLQLEIAKRAILHDEFKNIRYVAGVDLAYLRGNDEGLAVIIILDYPSLTPLEARFAKGRVKVPYIPGLLAFREAPLAYTAFTRLSIRPDLIIVDGHGRAHPRKAGIATHIGVALDTPSIGVAKKRLAGVECKYGIREALCIGNEVVAVILEHRRRRLYVSPGHRVSLKTAYELVRNMLKPRATLPLPTYIADKLSKIAKTVPACLQNDIQHCEEKLLEEAKRIRGKL